MATKLVYLGVVILAIIAIFLGYKIYQQQVIFKQNSTSLNSNTDSNSKTNTPTPTTTSSAQNLKPEDMINRFPDSNASNEERGRFFADLLRLGLEGELISINNCKPTPVILRIKKGSNLRIRNEDDVDHSFTVQGQESLVKAKSTLDLQANWEVGATGFHCDRPRVGIINIVE